MKQKHLGTNHADSQSYASRNLPYTLAVPGSRLPVFDNTKIPPPTPAFQE